MTDKPTIKTKIKDLPGLEREYRTSGIANRILGPKYGCSKQYVTYLAKRLGREREVPVEPGRGKLSDLYGLTQEKELDGVQRKYKTPEDMDAAIQRMFKKCEKEETVATIAGLALELGFASRSSLYAYEERGGAFADVINKARTRIEAVVEAKCVNEGRAGQIFWLKNRDNAQWVDKKEQLITTKRVDEMEGEELGDYVRDLESELARINERSTTRH